MDSLFFVMGKHGMLRISFGCLIIFRFFFFFECNRAIHAPKFTRRAILMHTHATHTAFGVEKNAPLSNCIV